MKLIHRIKILLALVQEMGGKVAGKDLHSLLFLYCHHYVEHNHYYDFIPQETGPYSLQAAADKETLIHKKCLEKSEDWLAKEGLERCATGLDFFEKIALQQLKNAWEGKESEVLQAFAKEQYPEYFTAAAGKAENGAVEPQFFTIGYEGRSPENYLNILRENGVRLLCDVRKNAFSQKYGFSRQELQAALAKVGIAYQHMPSLGVASEERQQLHSKEDYRALFVAYERETLPKAATALAELAKLAQQHQRVAITCFEADPYCCHRSKVAEALQKRGDFPYRVWHL